MSVTPPLQEADNICASPMKEDDPDNKYVNWPELPCAQSPGYEPLDWGSDPEDNEACMHLLSYFPTVYEPTESHQPLKG